MVFTRLLHERRKRTHDREASVSFRRNLLESQIRVNYVNEFDRLKRHLYANRNLPAPTNTHLKERLQKLQDLAKQSLFGRYNLYKDTVDDYKKDLEDKK